MFYFIKIKQIYSK